MPSKTRRKSRSAPPRPSRGMGARVRKPAAAETIAGAPPAVSRPAPIRDLCAAAAIYLALTLLLSYPLALHPASLSRLDNGDARLNAWAISWVAHQVVSDPLRLFEANTFHPLPHSLAYSEHLAVLGVLALPLLRLTDDLVLTTNLLLLFAMFASALGMYLLARSLTGSHYGSLLAGIFFSFASFRFNRLPHIQMQLYAFLPLFLAFWHRYLESRKRTHLALALCAFVLQALSGTYLGAISAVALATAVATLAPFSSLSRRQIGEIALGLLLAALALAPFAAPYLWVNRELGVEWDLPGIASLSATPSSYLASSSRLYRGLSEELWREDPPSDYLFPGITLGLLAPAGAFLLARERGKRRLLLCYGAILALGVLISLGPRTPLYPLLFEHVVFFRGLRALTRFALLPLLSVSVFAAFAAARLFDSSRSSSRRRLGAAAIAAFFAAESTALPYQLERFSDEPPEVYRWLASAPPGPFVELPFKVIDTQYMFWARHHGFRPTLNGDSGFIPASHQWIRSALARFPSIDSVALLRRLGIRYVVLHLGAFREGALLRLLNGIAEYSRALVPARDFGRDVVFEVAPEPDAAWAAADPPLTRLRAESDRSELFDSDVDRPAAAASIEMRLPAGVKLEALRFHYGRAPRVPVERVEILSAGKLLWSSDPSWPPITELVMGLLETPLDGTQTVPIRPALSIGGEPLQIRLHGLDGEPAELTEIEALGPAEGAERAAAASDP